MEGNEKTWVDDLKEEIDTNIKPNNHKREITGAKLNTTLKEMVDELSDHTPKSLSELEDDTMHRTVTDEEKQTWGKSAAIFDEQQEYNDAERLQALANVSNQDAGYESEVFTGKMGYVVLQPEDDEDLEHTSFAAQIADKPNTIFEIRDVYDCGGTVETPVSVALPDNCTLKFNGGMLKNCTLSTNTPIVVENPSDKQIFSNVDASQRITMLSVKTSWFGNTTSEIKKGLDILIYSAVEINGDITFDGTTLPLWSVNNYTCKNAKITAPAFETEKEVVHLFVDWLPIELSNMQIILTNGFKGVGVAVYSTYSGEFESQQAYWQSSRNKYGWCDIYLPQVIAAYESNLYYNESEGIYTNESIGVAIRPGVRAPYNNGMTASNFQSMFFCHFHVNAVKVTTACLCDTVDWDGDTPTVWNSYYGMGRITITSWTCVNAFEQESSLGLFYISIYHQADSHTKKLVKLSEPFGNEKSNNRATYYVEIYDDSLIPEQVRSTMIDNTSGANYNSPLNRVSFQPVSSYFATKSVEYNYNNGSQEIWKYQPLIFNTFEAAFGSIRNSLNAQPTAELKIKVLVDLYNSKALNRNAVFYGVSGKPSAYYTDERSMFILDSEIINSVFWGSHLVQTKIVFLTPRKTDSTYTDSNICSVMTEAVDANTGMKFVNVFNVDYDSNGESTVTLKSSKRENLVIDTMADYYKLNEGEIAYLKSHGKSVTLINHNLYYLDGSPVLPLSPTLTDITQAPLLDKATLVYDGLSYAIVPGIKKGIRASTTSAEVPAEDFDVKITLGSEEEKTISINVSVYTTLRSIVDYIVSYFNSHYDSAWALSRDASNRIIATDRKFSGNISSTGSKISWNGTDYTFSASANPKLSTYAIHNFTKYPESGTLALRPTITEGAALTGFRYFATDVHKWITWDGIDWYYDDGTQVS